MAEHTTKQITVTGDKKITDIIFNELHTCDADALAHVFEILTGLPCCANGGEQYTFFIDENNREDFERYFKK